jgi:phage anti-repressor protein
MCEIDKYNNNLVSSKTIINIIDYVKAINKLKYNIDINFIDEFIELVNKDECCIHHNMLQKYNILNLKNGSTNIKRILDQYEFIENEDFKLLKVEEFNSNGGRGNKNEYYLHPRAFKICLMRSLKTKIYAKYYLLLEECIKYFNEYQIELNKKYMITLEEKIKEKDNIIVEKDTNISKLGQDIKQLLNNNNTLLSENKEMKDILVKNQLKLDKTFEKLVGMNEELRDVKDKLDDTNDILEDTNEELVIIKDKLEDTNEELITIKDKLDIATDDRVVKTRSGRTLEYLIILKTEDVREDYKYYIIRCQKRSIKQRLEVNPNFREIKRIECVPNSINLFNRIKEKLASNIKIRSNRLNLKNITESEFLNKIDMINQEKKII